MKVVSIRVGEGCDPALSHFTRLLDDYSANRLDPLKLFFDLRGFYGWQVGGTFMGVLEHSEMGGNIKDPGRVMLNFETTQIKEEFERIKAIGATPAPWPATSATIIRVIRPVAQLVR